MQLDILIARQFLADLFLGEHHVPDKIRVWGEGYFIKVPNEMATVDFNQLTRLVILAHEYKIRASLDALNCQYMRLMLHARAPDPIGEQRQTMQGVLNIHDNWRERNPEMFKIKGVSMHYVESEKDRKKRERKAERRKERKQELNRFY